MIDRLSSLTPSSDLPEGISVIVPVYNSADSLAELTHRVTGVLAGEGCSFEILLVNDDSRDTSWEVISTLARRDARIRGINLSRNYGQHNALLCGVREVGYSVTVTIDDDLQNPPEEIPGLISKLEPATDVVYGTPEHEKHGLMRRIASRLTKLLLRKSMGAETASRVSAFRVFRTALRDSFSGYRGSFVSIDVLLTWGTTSFDSIPVRHDPRKHGSSNYDLRRLARHALNMMTGFSTVPLELASLIGFTFTIFGLLVLVYVVGRYFIESCPIPGFPFLASIIAIFSGVQLFSLGIIGEYLARMHFRMMDRPQYTVRSITGTGQGEE